MVTLPKLFMLPFLLIEDITRGGKWLVNLAARYFHSSPDNPVEGFSMSRSQFLSRAALVIGAIPFASLSYGILRGPFRFQTRRKTLKFSELPVSFHGLRAIQISDIHSGSFGSTAPMKRGIEMVMKEKPDIIFFTGDLVNDISEEAIQFMEVLKELKAPMGVYSIMGNHDYGDYYYLPHQTEEKLKNREVMLQIHKDLGWNLLNNAYKTVEKNGEKMVIAGVENWSSFGNFPKYGKIDEALNQITDNPFLIMLSHDPTHWDGEILKHHVKSHLTLSGHTHGFQFGVDASWLRWSPVSFAYKQWADLYEKNGQYLYVNRGFGFLGYPGRVGIMPEITVFTLEKS